MVTRSLLALAVLSIGFVARIAPAAALPFEDCPRLVPLAVTSVSANTLPAIGGTEYRYTVTNRKGGSDHVASFGLIGVNTSQDRFTAPPGWHSLPGKHVIEWIPVAPSSSPGAYLAPMFSSDADLAPGESATAFVVTSTRSSGFMLFKAGISRNITDKVNAYKQWAAEQGPLPTDPDTLSEELQEGYANVCGPTSGAIPQIYSYGVTTGPSGVPTVRADIAKDPATSALTAQVFGLAAMPTRLRDVTQVVIMNAEQKRDLPLGKGNLRDVDSDGVEDLFVAIPGNVLATFSCRTQATLLAFRVAEVTVMTARIEAQALGLPGSCF